MQYIKLGLDKQSEHNTEIYRRLNSIEQRTALAEQWMNNYDKDIDRKMASANIKIGVVGAVVAIVSILVSTGLVIYFGG